MNEEQQVALEALVQTNEDLEGARCVIDFAIILACDFSDKPGSLNQEMTDYVEKIYQQKDHGNETSRNHLCPSEVYNARTARATTPLA